VVLTGDARELFLRRAELVHVAHHHHRIITVVVPATGKSKSCRCQRDELIAFRRSTFDRPSLRFDLYDGAQDRLGVGRLDHALDLSFGLPLMSWWRAATNARPT